MGITVTTVSNYNQNYDSNLLLSTTHTLDLVCPIGTIVMWTQSWPPRGWLICNGGTFNQTTYPDLYHILGTNKLPNFSARMPMGVGTGTSYTVSSGQMGGEYFHKLTINEIPSHAHSYMFANAGDVNADGANDQRTFVRNHPYDKRSTTPVGGDGSHNNIPPFYGIYFIIKAEHAINHLVYDGQGWVFG